MDTNSWPPTHPKRKRKKEKKKTPLGFGNQPWLEVQFRAPLKEANLDSFEANWVLKLDLALGLSLHLGSPNYKLSFELFSFVLVRNNWLSLQNWCHVGLASICQFFSFGHLSKGHGSNLWLFANGIALFHGTLDLGPLSKVALSGPICARRSWPVLWSSWVSRRSWPVLWSSWVSRRTFDPLFNINPG